MDEAYLTIRQAVVLLHYSDRRIREFCKAGKFPGAGKLCSGRKWLIPSGDIERHLQSLPSGQSRAPDLTEEGVFSNRDYILKVTGKPYLNKEGVLVVTIQNLADGVK